MKKPGLLRRMAIATMPWIPKLGFLLFHRQYTKLMLELMLSVQYPYTTLDIDIGVDKKVKNKRSAIVVGFDNNHVYVRIDAKLTPVTWDRVTCPTYADYLAKLNTAAVWTESEGYKETLRVLHWLDSLPEKHPVRYRPHGLVDEHVMNAGDIRRQCFVKGILKIKHNMFMFALPQFTTSFVYRPVEVEILVDETPA